MSCVLDLVRNSPFGGPVSRAKCEGFKVNEDRTVAALSAPAGLGMNDVEILRSAAFLKGTFRMKLETYAVQGQANRRWEVLLKAGWASVNKPGSVSQLALPTVFPPR